MCLVSGRKSRGSCEYIYIYILFYLTRLESFCTNISGLDQFQTSRVEAAVKNDEKGDSIGSQERGVCACRQRCTNDVLCHHFSSGVHLHVKAMDQVYKNAISFNYYHP